MARQTHDREDLFRDGTQMPIRGRKLIGEAEVVVGFRDAGPASLYGSASLYWDQDPVYQFNAGGELRRAFFDGVRFSAERGVLLRLVSSSLGSRPRRSEATVKHLQLSRQPLANNQSSEILDHLHFCLVQLSASLLHSESSNGESSNGESSNGESSNWQSKGESVETFCQRLTGWIATMEVPYVIAQGPAVSHSPAGSSSHHEGGH